MPEFCGPLFRSVFLVNKKSLFLQKCQCIEFLTVFYRLLIVLSYYFSPQVPLCIWVKSYFVLVCQKRGIIPTNTTSFDMNIFKNNNKKFLSQDTIFLHQRFPPFPPPFYFSSAKYLPPSFLTSWQEHLCCCRRGFLLSCSTGSHDTQHQRLEEPYDVYLFGSVSKLLTTLSCK